jgi:predicted deacylase
MGFASACLVIVVIVVLYTLLVKTLTNHCSEIETFTFTSDKDGPSILLVGGTHGNEPAGAVALETLIHMFASDQIALQRGSITLIPRMNKCGLNLGVRWLPHQLLTLQHIDLNRNYPKTPGEEAGCAVSKQVTQLADTHDLVIDLHEGWGYAQINKHSMGSGVYSANLPLSQTLADVMTTSVNKTISDEMPKKKFIHQRNYADIPGTLRWHCNGTNKEYILIETSGQNNLQPLPVRVNQDIVMIMSVLQSLHMV